MAPSSGLGSDLLQLSASSKAVYTLRSSMSSSLVVTAQWTLPTASSWSSDSIGLRCLLTKYFLQNKARCYGYNNCYSSESSYNIVSLYSSQTCFYTRSKLPQNNMTANQCADISGVTGFTWLLLPFYYFPLIVLALVCSVILTHHVR